MPCLVHPLAELPKKYPHQLMRIDIAAVQEPSMHFSSDRGIQLQVRVCAHACVEQL